MGSIVGTKELSGYGYDTFAMRYPNGDWYFKDSMYSINKNITFFKVNDSTVRFQGDVDILSNYILRSYQDTILHYKLTDPSSNTITFQNYHTNDYKTSTLTYNYVTNKTIFEQHIMDGSNNRYLKIE
jgi:hypothetical protein